MKIVMQKRVVNLAVLSVTIAGMTFASTPVQAQSGFGKITGVGFEDRNANGKRDAGEPTTFGRYKVTSGGNFWTCGNTGRDATFGVVVAPGTYFVMPIAGPGQFTTAPVIKVEVKGAGQTASADLPFTISPLATADQCGAYAPKRTARVPLGIPETALGAGLITLSSAIEAAGLFDTLSQPGPYTVFAPTDLAFAKIPGANLDAILKDKALLQSVLTVHVVPGRVSANDVVNSDTLTTVNGEELKITTDAAGDVFINGARVVATDVSAANGIVHVVDTVLVPRGLSVPGTTSGPAPEPAP